MSEHRPRAVRRALGTLAATTIVLAGTAVVAGPASAHVTVDPTEAEQGGYARLAFRVPNESETASTIALEVRFPTDTPVSSIRTKPKVGWTAEIEKQKLPKPVVEGEREITEAVTSVTWTADRGVKIGPGEFEEFEVSGGPLPAEAEQLALPAIQTYDDGEVVRWDQVPAAGEGEPERPAPVLILVEGSGDHHTTSSEEKPEPAAGSTQARQAGAAGSGAAVDQTARVLGGIGIGVGVLTLAVVLYLAVSWRGGAGRKAPGKDTA